MRDPHDVRRDITPPRFADFRYQKSFHGVNLMPLHEEAMQEYFRQPIVDTFDIRICMSKSIKHSVDFLTNKESDLHEIGKVVNIRHSSAEWTIWITHTHTQICFFIIFDRHSTWISRPSNGNLPWASILVWCRIQRFVATNMAVNIADCTADALVSSEMFAAESNLCASRPNHYRPGIAGGQQTTKLRCHDKTKHRRNKHRIEQYSRLEKSIFPIYGRTNATAAWH